MAYKVLQAPLISLHTTPTSIPSHSAFVRVLQHTRHASTPGPLHLLIYVQCTLSDVFMTHLRTCSRSWLKYHLHQPSLLILLKTAILPQRFPICISCFMFLHSHYYHVKYYIFYLFCLLSISSRQNVSSMMADIFVCFISCCTPSIWNSV